MEIKESYRVLELAVGATREAVEAAYCRLLERWHPDRAASGGGGPEAVREAQRMVQAVNDAYQTLVKIAPGSAKAPTPPPAAGARPSLIPLPPGQPAIGRPPPPPAPSPAPAKPLPPQPVKMTPTPAASAPPPAATAARAFDFSTEQTTMTFVLRRKAEAFYDTLFPPGSPRRRFGPVIVAGVAVLFLLLVVKCASKSPETVKAEKAAIEAQTTGRLVVKANRPNTTIEATLIPAVGMAAPAPRQGPAEGAAEQTMATLPPGNYVLTARSEGWPDIRQEVTLDAGRTTDVAIQFKTGSLRLDSDPNGATVKFGSSVLGQTPLTIAQLPPGECQLSLQYPSWPAVAFQTTITENVESTATVHLPHGKLTVESTPPGATIRMGGRAIGQTPLTLDHVPTGPNKLLLLARNFPTLEVSVTVEDRRDAKVQVQLGSGFPLLDAAALLRAVWVPDNPDKLSAQFDTAGPYQPQNGIVKNLHRKRLYEFWLRKNYRYSEVVKSYDPDTGEVEFAEQKSELSRYRVLAKLSPAARNDKSLATQLAKGATFALYGSLSAVEEPKWPSKVITFEISAAEPLQ